MAHRKEENLKACGKILQFLMAHKDAGSNVARCGWDGWREGGSSLALGQCDCSTHVGWPRWMPFFVC